MAMEQITENSVKKVCPSEEDLSIVLNDIRCEGCHMHFKNIARYRMHNLKVHKDKNYKLKASEESEKNVQYHCPINNCIYAINCNRFFTQKRYLKQVRILNFRNLFVFTQLLINHFLLTHFCFCICMFIIFWVAKFLLFFNKFFIDNI